jgi:hypothetical protein
MPSARPKTTRAALGVGLCQVGPSSRHPGRLPQRPPWMSLARTRYQQNADPPPRISPGSCTDSAWRGYKKEWSSLGLAACLENSTAATRERNRRAPLPTGLLWRDRLLHVARRLRVCSAPKSSDHAQSSPWGPPPQIHLETRSFFCAWSTRVRSSLRNSPLSPL